MIESSSWESEPEGEGSAELASMEPPDDEGGWCWPKRNRVTRWRKRSDPRPTFHYLTEDDGEEQAPAGLNHLVQPNAEEAQSMWKKVTVVVNSGAAENMMPRSLFAKIGIRATERS